MSKSVADHVVRDRLWERHMLLARHGATAANGVNRQALSAAEIAARRELIGWGADLGLKPYSDAAGNFFLRLEGRDPAAAPVLSGSHIDSQPTGGKFDGVYGVLAALEAVQAICDSGQTPVRPIEIVAWMNEEGSRFAPGMMGSAVYAGDMALGDILPVRDAEGITVEQGLADMAHAFPEVPQRALGRPVAAYVEAHIEQGPVLEKRGFSIGVVTGIQGKRTFRVSVSGEDAHAGTAALRERKDALLAATAMIQALSAAMHDDEDIVKFTVGRLEIKPNAPSVVAGHALFSIDLRHPRESRLREFGDRVTGICTANADFAYLMPEQDGEMAAEEIRGVREAGMRFVLTRGGMPTVEADLETRLRPLMGAQLDRILDREETLFPALEKTIARYHDTSEGSMLQVAIGPTSVTYLRPQFMRRFADLARPRYQRRPRRGRPGQ